MMGNLEAAAFGALIWLSILRIFCAVAKKEWKLNLKSWKSWLVVVSTTSISVFLFLTCQCGGLQGGIHNEDLKLITGEELIGLQHQKESAQGAQSKVKK